MIWRSCSWCNESNRIADDFCWNCGHMAHVPRAECACSTCQRERIAVIEGARAWRRTSLGVAATIEASAAPAAMRSYGGPVTHGYRHEDPDPKPPEGEGGDAGNGGQDPKPPEGGDGTGASDAAADGKGSE